MSKAGHRLRAAIVVATFAVVPFCAPGIALADPSAADKETARSLVEQGDKLTASGDAAGALKMYKGAHTIMGVPSTGLRLGRAQVNAGQLVEARDTFLSVARFPQTAGEPAAFTEARTHAQAEAESLQSRIPSIEIVPSGLAANVTPTVRIDDQTVSSAAGLLPQKVNPGAHAIAIRAPGYAEAKAQVTVKEGETQRVPIALVPEPNAPASIALATPSSSTGDGAHASGTNTKRLAGFIVGGVGIVGIGVGAVFGLQAFSKKSDRDGHCNSDGSVCDATGIQLDSDGRSAATISTISFAAGLVALGVGTYLVVTSKSSSSSSASVFSPTNVGVGPLLGAGTGGLEMRGAW